MAKRVRLLLTGFSEFPGVPVNPTEELIRRLKQASISIAPEANTKFAVLPVEYGRGLAELRRHCREFDPHLTISFGVDAKSTGLRVEQIAHNRVRTDRPDAGGFFPDQAFVHADASPSVPTRLPVARLEHVLTEAGLPVEPSKSAGEYLCNAIFFDTLHGFADKPDRWAGFIHVPMPRAGAISQDDLEMAARLAIDTSVSAYRKIHGSREL